MTPTPPPGDRLALLFRVLAVILFGAAVWVVTFHHPAATAKQWGGLVAGGLLAFVLSTF